MLENTLSQAPEPSEQMLRLLTGHCLEQAIYVAAVLGIADLLREGAKSSDELARVTEAEHYIDYCECSPA
jgi:hypothetical protein